MEYKVSLNQSVPGGPSFVIDYNTINYSNIQFELIKISW